MVMSLTPLGDALKEKLGKKGPLQQQVESAQAIEYATAVFEELFEKELAAEAKPLFLKNRTLTVTCGSSALAQEIRLNQAQIVKKINQKLGKKEVDRIRYLV
jgi:predicted nucleic acid-binding Zn ribbon protein